MAAEDDVDGIDAAIAALRSKLEQATAGERRARSFSPRSNTAFPTAEHVQRYVALARQ
jgi:hypothetical protein